MFSKFNKHIDTIFLDTICDNFHTDNSVNIILSPSLYWIKKIILPVKSAKEAKPLLASIFEDTLPDGAYSYSVYKNDDDFLAFAYEDKKILELLEQKGIKQTQINNIYFSQNEFSDITKAMKINETQSIFVKDGIVVLLPCCWIKEHGYLNLDSINLSKKYINIRQYSHLVDEKSLYMITILSVIFTIFVASEYFISIQNISNLTDKKDEIFQKYSLKPTMMQNNAMLKGYEKINKQQTNLRVDIASVLSLNLPSEVKLTLLKSTNKKLIVHFNSVDKNSQLKIKQQLKKKNLIFSSNLKNGILEMEFRL